MFQSKKQIRQIQRTNTDGNENVNFKSLYKNFLDGFRMGNRCTFDTRLIFFTGGQS